MARSLSPEPDRAVWIAREGGRLGGGGAVALRAAIARDLGAERELVIDPGLLDVGVDGVVAQGLAQDLEAALELAAEDRVLGVGGAHRAAGVGDARGPEQRGGELVFAIDEVLAVLAAEH